jgi:hypothetical protein
MGIASALAGATLAALGAAAPALAAEFDVSPAMLTVAFAAQTVGMLAGAMCAAASRHRPPTMRGVALGTALALAITAAAPSFAVFTAALAVAGAGCYALNAAARAIAMNALGAARAAALSRYHVLGALGRWRFRS